MPITQSRLKDLLEEHEAWIAALDRFYTWFIDVKNAKTNPENKLDLLESELAGLRALSRTYAIVERRWIKANWKRNERLALRQTSKRRLKGMKPQLGTNDTAPSNQLVIDREYEEFNAGIGAYSTGANEPDNGEYLAFNTGNLPANETEAEQCKRELQLKELPSEALLENWREMRKGVLKNAPNPFD